MRLTSVLGLVKQSMSASASALDSQAPFLMITKAVGLAETDTQWIISPFGSKTRPSLRTHKFSNPRSTSTTSVLDKSTPLRLPQTCSMTQHTEFPQACLQTVGMNNRRMMSWLATSRRSIFMIRPWKASNTSIQEDSMQKVCSTSMSQPTTMVTPKWTSISRRPSSLQHHPMCTVERRLLYVKKTSKEERMDTGTLKAPIRRV